MDALLSRATLIGSAYSSAPDDNAIINGGMDIWQRGTTASYAAGANGLLADLWRFYNSTTAGAATVNRITTNLPPVTAFCPLLNYALEVDITTLDSGADAGDLAILRYNIEGYNFLKLAQQPMTLSFWVKATVTGKHYVTLFNSVPDRYCIMPYTVITADTWEYKTIIIPASPSGGTWNYTNSIGLMINFVLCAGSTYTTGAVAGSWQTGGLYAVNDVVNDFSSASNFFRIAGVSLIPGVSPKPFVKKPYAQELFECQRYFERLVGPGASFPAYFGVAAGGSDARFIIFYQLKRAVSPTVTFSSNGALAALNNSFSAADTGTLTTLFAGYIIAQCRMNTIGAAVTLVVGDAVLIRWVSASEYIDIDSSL